MKNRLFTASLLIALCCGLNVFAHAQSVVLAPGATRTVQFDTLRILEKGTPPTTIRNVGAQITFTLDRDGETLTIKLKNISAANANAAFYALDLGLPLKQALQTRAEAAFTEFPADGEWLGPTDNIGVTAATGNFTFAARAAVLQRMEDFFDINQPLPASFLAANQSGCISLKLTFAEDNHNPTLRFTPTAYFLLPDARTNQPRRAALASRLNGNIQ